MPMDAIDEMRHQEHAKIMALPILGRGKFKWAGKILELPIIKKGKRDITLRSPDGTRVTLNKKFVEVLKDPCPPEIAGTRGRFITCQKEFPLTWNECHGIGGDPDASL